MAMGVEERQFYTPEWYIEKQKQSFGSARGKMLIASLSSCTELAREVKERYDHLLMSYGSETRVPFAEDLDSRFLDTETLVRLERPVNGQDVFIFQSLLNPESGRSVDQNYMALLIAARAFKEYGANHVTAVLPYLAYARQDKPTTFAREPTTAKLMAELTIEAGVDCVVTWDPHTWQLRGFYGSLLVYMLESLTLFIQEFERFRGRSDVIAVSPDAGASKFVTHFGRALGLDCAIGSKYRPKPEVAEMTDIIGYFKGKKVAIILDDMISSGGTMAALIEKLVKDHKIEEIYIGVSHNLCLNAAYDRLVKLHEAYNVKEVIVTDSIPQIKKFRDLPFLKVRSLADAMARTINRIHYNRSVSEVFYRPQS